MTGAGIPAGAFVGPVTDTPVTATAAAQSGGTAVTGSFTLVNDGRATGRHHRRGERRHARRADPATDPLYDATTRPRAAVTPAAS